MNQKAFLDFAFLAGGICLIVAGIVSLASEAWVFGPFDVLGGGHVIIGTVVSSSAIWNMRERSDRE